MKQATQPLAQPAAAPAAATDARPDLRSALVALARVLGRQAAAEFVPATTVPTPHLNLESCT